MSDDKVKKDATDSKADNKDIVARGELKDEELDAASGGGLLRQTISTPITGSQFDTLFAGAASFEPRLTDTKNFDTLFAGAVDPLTDKLKR